MERIYHFDNIKFFMISLVVIGHIIEPMIWSSITLKTLYLYIYLIHMPLLIFISGYFSKNFNSDRYVVNVIGKLVIPYFIFETLYTVFDYWLFESEQLTFTYFIPYWIMWFLFSLSIWKVTLPYFVKLKYPLLISIVLAILVGYANDVGYYASVSRTIVFFPFFLAGYYFDKDILRKYMTKYFKVIAGVLLLAIYVGTFYVSQEINPQWLYGSISYESLGYDQWYAGVYRLSILAVSSIMILACIIFIPMKRIPIISQMGTMTIFVYLLHGFIIRYLLDINIYTYISEPIEKIGLILLGIVITFILSLPFVKQLMGFLVTPNTNQLFKN